MYLAPRYISCMTSKNSISDINSFINKRGHTRTSNDRQAQTLS